MRFVEQLNEIGSSQLANRINNIIIIKLKLIKIIKRKMLKALSRLQPLSTIKINTPKSMWQNKRNLFLAIALSPSLWIINKLYNKQKQQSPFGDHDKYQMPQRKPQNNLILIIKYLVRFIQLFVIFMPSIILLPLCLSKRLHLIWLDIFLASIKKAGLVWIKSFQYLSHRRDILGKEMADKFSVLRQNSPSHTLQDTIKTIKNSFGKSVEDMFDEFQYKSIASGSVGQVYKAKFKGKNVAVKVRHPGAGKNLEIDIDLLFAFSKIFSIFSKKFEIPILRDSLKVILSEQLLFLRQKKNLDIFNRIVVDKSLKFPKVQPQSTNQVLIQQFIEGKTIDYYQTNPHHLNRLMANIGAKGFFSMLMHYNFVHADCHAGNIIVKINKSANILQNLFYFYKNKIQNYILSKVMKYGFESDYLKRLSQENYEYDDSVQNLIKQHKESVQIYLIDAGMTIRLTKEKKDSLKQFLEQIVKGDPEQCAKWIFRISEYNGRHLKEGQYNAYFNDLYDMFKRVHKTTLQNLEGIIVLNEMLGVIRDHNMKIDGEISILLTNMLVLESVAKDLDPKINILRCMIPYLQYQ